MDLAQAQNLALQEMARFPVLETWSFGWNRRTRAHGLCRYDQRRIELSAPLTEREPDAEHILNTIRHEIAHALAGPGSGHGPCWRHWAALVGCTHLGSARACSEEAALIPPRYALVALIDGQERVLKTYHRRPSRKFLASLSQRHVRGHPETRGTLRLRRLG